MDSESGNISGKNEKLQRFLEGSDFMRLGHAIETGNQQAAIMIVNGMQRQLAEAECDVFASNLINIRQCIINGAKTDALDILSVMTVRRIQLQKNFYGEA